MAVAGKVPQQGRGEDPGVVREPPEQRDHRPPYLQTLQKGMKPKAHPAHGLSSSDEESSNDPRAILPSRHEGGHSHGDRDHHRRKLGGVQFWICRGAMSCGYRRDDYVIGNCEACGRPWHRKLRKFSSTSSSGGGVPPWIHQPAAQDAHWSVLANSIGKCYGNN